MRYNGKDSLLVVTKDQGNKTSFEELEGQPSVQKIKYDQLLPRLPTPAAVDSSTEILSTPSANNQQEQYSSGVTEAVVRLQRRWRACFTRIEQRRAFVLLPLGRAINRFFELGALCSSTISIRDRIAIRGLLVSDGVAIFMRQNAVNGKIQQLQQDAMACVENIEISHSVDESVDDVLGATTEAEDQLRKAVERMSDESLAGLIKRGELFGVQQAFGDVEGFVAGAEQRMTAARVAISTIMKSPI